MTYLLDANIFIQAKNLHYSFDFCPAFWDWPDRANASHKVFSIDKVRDELVAGDDSLAKWASDRGAAFYLPPNASIVQSLGVVSRWANSGVYEQGPSPSTKRIKIPNACIDLGVKVMSPYEMLRTERARFVLGSL